MFRLILLTLVGLFGVLAFYGTPEMAGGSVVADKATLLPVALPPALELDRPRLAGIPAEALIRAALAGPAPQEVVAGPRLQASPEFAGRVDPAASEAGPESGVLYTTASEVNLRATPEADGTLVAALPRGEAVRPVAPAVGAWVEVEVGQASGAQRGFVSARYLSRKQPG